MNALIYYLATLLAFCVAVRVGESHVRALKSAGCWHVHGSQVAFTGNGGCLCLVLTCWPFVSAFLLKVEKVGMPFLT